MSARSKCFLLSTIVSIMVSAAFGQPSIVNSDFGAVAIVCPHGYAYQGTGGCEGPEQDFNSTPGFGWTLGHGDGGSGLTNQGSVFYPPPFGPFTQAVFLQGNSFVSQVVGGFTARSYTLSFYLGSRRYYDGNQTVQALMDGNVIGTWSLTSNTLFTFKTVSFTVRTDGSHTLEFRGINAGDHTAFVSGVSISSAQFTTIHAFSYDANQGVPWAGVTIDPGGALYGTTSMGGVAGFGSVYKLEHSLSGWTLTTLYSFTGGTDGAYPRGRVALAPDGSLYGTTDQGGAISLCSGYGCGTVFHLTQSRAVPNPALAPWNETVLHSFVGSDGAAPRGDLTFDQSGSIYGTSLGGGDAGNGVIYKLTPTGDGWTETVLYSALDSGDGKSPYGGVVFDNAGNLYGVFGDGGPGGGGAVYQLTPSESGWTEQTLQSFVLYGEDGAYPRGGLIIDSSGTLYGTTGTSGENGGGTAFSLTPVSGGWTFTTLYSFWGGWWWPYDKLTLDTSGSLYGTTSGGGPYGFGTAFKLTPSSSGWTYTSLHDFVGGWDGGGPMSNLVFDGMGNLYGTALWSVGPSVYEASGTVFQITP